MENIIIYILCCNEERENFMRKQMEDLHITYPVKYFKAYTPENSQDWILKDYINPKLQCCCRSHIEALKDFKENSKEEFVLILEDDVCLLKENFQTKLEKVIEVYKNTHKIIDYVSIGYLPTDFSTNPINIYFSLCKKIENIVYQLKDIKNTVWGAQAQVFSRTKLDMILNVIYKENGEEILNSVNEYVLKNGMYQTKGIFLSPDSIIPAIFSQGILESPFAIETNYGVGTSIHLLDKTKEDREKSWQIGHHSGFYNLNDFYSYNLSI